MSLKTSKTASSFPEKRKAKFDQKQRFVDSHRKCFV